LEEALSKYPIKELQNEKFKESLIRSLERGNLQSATFLINGKEEKIFLTPNVAFKALSAFDANMKKIKLSEVLEGHKQEQSNKQETSQKQTAKSETKIAGGNEKPVKKKSKRQKVT